MCIVCISTDSASGCIVKFNIELYSSNFVMTKINCDVTGLKILFASFSIGFLFVYELVHNIIRFLSLRWYPLYFILCCQFLLGSLAFHLSHYINCCFPISV